MCLFQSNISILNGMWFGAATKVDTEKICVFKEIGLHSQTMITILGSIINIFCFI
jgi:hypothetical protein